MSAVRRVLNFAGGFFVGLVVAPLAVAVAFLALAFAVSNGEDTPGEPFMLTTSGADITKASGSVVQVRRSTSELRQTCRDGCDDLRFEGGLGALETVRVLDGQGACIRCQDLSQPYAAVASGPWRVAGTPRLSVEQERHD